MRTVPVCLLLATLGATPGCANSQARTRDPRATRFSDGIGAPDGPRRQGDQALSLEAPAGWEVERRDDPEGGTLQADVRDRQGLFARVTLLPGAGDPAGFVAQVVANLRHANETLSTRPFKASLAGEEAAGVRYGFKAGDTAWAGCLVARATKRGLICFLGQFPEDREPALAPALEKAMQSLAFEERGGSAEGASSKP